MKVKWTFPVPGDDEDTYACEEEVTFEELMEEIHIFSKPSMFGPIGFTVEVLPE